MWRSCWLIRPTLLWRLTAGEAPTVDSSPAAPATAEPSSESASPGKSRRRSSLSFWPRPRRASLEQEGSAQQAPPAPPQQQMEVPEQRVASRRGSQQCQPVAEPDQATTPASQTVSPLYQGLGSGKTLAWLRLTSHVFCCCEGRWHASQVVHVRGQATCRALRPLRLRRRACVSSPGEQSHADS